MASQDEHHTTSELGEQLQNHQDEDVSTDERDRIAVVQWFVLLQPHLSWSSFLVGRP
jgi:hypothetical protein